MLSVSLCLRAKEEPGSTTTSENVQFESWSRPEVLMGPASISPRSPNVLDVLREIEREWRAELGPKNFTQLKELLCRIWESPLVR